MKPFACNISNDDKYGAILRIRNYLKEIIKQTAYYPKAFEFDQKYTNDVRAAVMGVLQGDNSVRVKLEPEEQAPPDNGLGYRLTP